MSDQAKFVEDMKTVLSQIIANPEAQAVLEDQAKFNAASVSTLLDLQNGLSNCQMAQTTLIGMCFVALKAKPEQVEVSSVDPTTVSFYIDGVWVASMHSSRDNLAHAGKNISLATGITFSAEAFLALDRAGGCTIDDEPKAAYVGAN